MITAIIHNPFEARPMMSATRTKNSNFNLPEPLKIEYDKLCNQWGDKSKMKWAVAAAALMELLQLPQTRQRELIGKMIGARAFTGEIERLIMDAKARAASESTSDSDDPGQATVSEPPQQSESGPAVSPTQEPLLEPGRGHAHGRAGRRGAK